MTNKIIRVVLSGPESTGKTWLAEKLAEHYKTVFVPEFARKYIENLDRQYIYEDVEFIAKKQIEQLPEFLDKAKDIIFIDTWLVITKVWFNEVFGKQPHFIDNQLQAIPIDIYLLCLPDIDWEFDPVRENPNNRDYLFNLYKNEINKLNKAYAIIEGKGSDRLTNAINAITAFIDNQ